MKIPNTGRRRPWETCSWCPAPSTAKESLGLWMWNTTLWSHPAMWHSWGLVICGPGSKKHWPAGSGRKSILRCRDWRWKESSETEGRWPPEAEGGPLGAGSRQEMGVPVTGPRRTKVCQQPWSLGSSCFPRPPGKFQPAATLSWGPSWAHTDFDLEPVWW